MSTFSEIKEIGKGGYGTVFRAKTKVQRISHWDYQSNQWSRLAKDVENYTEYVALKTIGHCESLSKDFLNEVTNLCLFIIFMFIILNVIHLPYYMDCVNI